MGTFIAAVLGSVLLALVSNRTPPAGQANLAVTPVAVIEDEAKAFSQYAGSQSCRECHAAAFDSWATSNHALAERPVDEKLDRQAFDPPKALAQGGERFEFRRPTTQPGAVELVVSDAADGTTRTIRPVRVIGNDPLRQFLFETDSGRLQSTAAAYDPHQDEWFDVYGPADIRQRGDWGHWTGRGMNWNTMCASCHNTRVRKNYDPASDTYQTRMAEVSLGCESCHGPMKDHVQWQKTEQARLPAGAPKNYGTDPTIRRIDREQMFDTCASCHARRGDLTGDFVPGQSFYDHYQLVTVDESDLYYPDGQVRDEDYEMAAFLGSRMHAAGVRCADCHHPHTAKPILEGDFLCMRCHQGGETNYPTAPVIKPAEHVFHKPDTEGARCVDCHMPRTTYMQRHVRHDHGFTVPDPLLTKELGIPNACNRCHTDKDADWSIAWVDKWYGPKMERPSRQRTRVIAAARRDDPSARQPLLDLLADAKQAPYWKAVAAGLLDAWSHEPPVASALLAQLRQDSPLVRSSAARSLEPVLGARPDAREAMQGLLADPSRVVRVTAAWALREELALDSPADRELRHMLDFNADQPLGQLQLAHWSLARQDLPGAVSRLQTAVKWDPSSAGLRRELAVVLSMAGRPRDALAHLEEACRLDPRQADFRYMLGLAHHELNDLPRAIAALEEAVRLDPRHVRAQYNLGLAYHASGRSSEALDALSRAESADTVRDPGIPYARATILAQLSRHQEAADAARRALDLREDFQPARQLLVQLMRDASSTAR